jgi:hypothetical protein
MSAELLISEIPITNPIFREGHVWTAPNWQENLHVADSGEVQPCVRPVVAVHMTAGHNALGGSGPVKRIGRTLDIAISGAGGLLPVGPFHIVGEPVQAIVEACYLDQADETV